jgi:WD40 repeat protein
MEINITCSYDKTMKVIKLIGEDEYEIEQTLQGHKSYVCKVIEIKENELISISYDKTMKIWELNNENKFEYIKTINFQNSKNDCNILKLNENEFVIMC